MKVPVPVKGSRICTPGGAQGAAELFPEHGLDGVENEVHDLDRRVDGTEPLRDAREGLVEELVVELDQDRLAGFRGGSALHTPADRFVEGVEALRFRVDACWPQHLDDGFHTLAHGVAVRGRRLTEQRVEYGLRDHVLGKHLEWRRPS